MFSQVQSLNGFHGGFIELFDYEKIFDYTKTTELTNTF